MLLLVLLPLLLLVLPEGLDFIRGFLTRSTIIYLSKRSIKFTSKTKVEVELQTVFVGTQLAPGQPGS